MNCYQWERGEFVLPASDFARVRQAVQAADKAHKDLVFARTQEVWKSLTRKEQTDPKAYRQALARIQQAKYDAQPRYRPGMRLSSPSASEIAREQREEMADRDAMDMLSIRVGWNDDKKPSRVLQSDMDYPTNRSTSFHDADSGVTFDPQRRTVIWEVPENNHARDHARSGPIARAFFDAVATVRWTHGTGAVIVGNDEYNRSENRDAGGGGNYVTDAYGYIGIEQAPNHVQVPFTNARGQRIGVEITSGAWPRPAVGKAVEVSGWGQARTFRERGSRSGGGQQGRVQRGVPTGGQFAARRTSEGTARL